MKKWIIITDCGYTQDDSLEDTEHCQMLGIYEADTPNEAAKYCRQELRELNQDYESLTVYQLVNSVAVTVTYGTHRKELDLDEVDFPDGY